MDKYLRLPSINSPWKDRTLTFVVLTVQFMAMTTDTFLIPFFPPEAKGKGASDTEIGIVFSAFEFSKVISAFIVGRLISQFSPRKCCLFGHILATASCISFGLISYVPNQAYLPLCIIVRMIAGCGSACIVVCGMSILLKATSYSNSTIIGLAQMIEGAGYSAGPAIGSGIYKLAGYGGMFWILGGFLAVLVIPMALVLPNIESEKQQEKKFHHLLVIPGILVLLVHCTVGKIVASARTTGISNFLIFTRAESGLFYGIWSLAFMIGCPIASFIATKGFTWSLMILAWCVSIFINLFTGPSPLLDFYISWKTKYKCYASYYLELPLSLIAIEFLFQSCMFVLPFQASLNLAEVNGHSKDSIQTYAAVSGTINSVYALGNMIGPIMGGAITENLNFPWMLTVMAFIEIVMMVTMVTYLLIMKISQQPLKPSDHIEKEEKQDNFSERSKLITNKLEDCFNDAIKEGITSSNLLSCKYSSKRLEHSLKVLIISTVEGFVSSFY
ncbi:hypothetical protein EB796_005247 [Bugula neritina]|uniref:SLC18B1 n=1 Tax=Bugula neritina TaxID=10212 RepID=A0A7J7KEZ3_BUGNE|nr:hypothetical protein EB796_005247 [Bugula neritina]